MSEGPFDVGRAATFSAQVSGDFGGAMISALAYIGDRLGIFDVLADGKPRTSVQLADDTGLNERYLREWAAALAASEYLNYEPASGSFRLTPEQAAVLVDRESPFYMAGSFLYAQASIRQLPGLIDAFRHGGGVAFADFGPEISEAIERLFANGYRAAVETQWIPAVPGLAARLTAGAEVAEVGCGAGQALIPVARAFARSHFTGYDTDPVSVERARQRAKASGVADRAKFERVPAEQIPDADRFDLMMAFNCIHDMAQPVDALKGIRRALTPGGVFLWSEARASDRLEENVGPMGRLLYAASAMHCMTVSLAHEGMGLGAVVGEAAVRRLSQDAGFASCEPMAVEHAYHRLFLLRK